MVSHDPRHREVKRLDRRGYTLAEGCMFLAVAIFALLLIGLLIVAFFRFSNPPEPVRNRMGWSAPLDCGDGAPAEVSFG